MRRITPVAVHCRISQGAFSDELVFEIDQPGQPEPYVGAASRQYFWNIAGVPFGEGEPAAGTQVRGLVAARNLKDRDSRIIVAIPDGEVIQVDKGQIRPRPAEPARDVPVEP